MTYRHQRKYLITIWPSRSQWFVRDRISLKDNKNTGRAVIHSWYRSLFYKLLVGMVYVKFLEDCLSFFFEKKNFCWICFLIQDDISKFLNYSCIHDTLRRGEHPQLTILYWKVVGTSPRVSECLTVNRWAHVFGFFLSQDKAAKCTIVDFHK